MVLQMSSNHVVYISGLWLKGHYFIFWTIKEFLLRFIGLLGNLCCVFSHIPVYLPWMKGWQVIFLLQLYSNIYKRFLEMTIPTYRIHVQWWPSYIMQRVDVRRMPQASNYTLSTSTISEILISHVCKHKHDTDTSPLPNQ